jgi:hypothetical protein
LISVLLAVSLATSFQAPAPTIHLVGTAQEGIAVETLALSSDGSSRRTGAFVLLFESSLALKLDGTFQLIQLSSQGRGTLTLTATDLAAAPVWHVGKLAMGTTSVFVWSAASRVGGALPRGSVIITAQSAACGSAETFRLGIVMGPPTVPALLPLVNSNDVGSCRWVAIGLPPGTYDAALRNASGSSGRQGFRVVANQITEVVIQPPAVTVSGVVTINGKPVSGGRVQFRRDMTFQAIVLQDDGSYSATFDDAGDFMLVMLAPLTRLKPATVTLARGANVFDWPIDEPSAESELAVQLRGHDRLTDTGIEIQANGTVLTRIFIPAGEDTVTQKGLPFGKYKVFARQPNAASDVSAVELSATTPSANVTLSLERSTRSITLRYIDGEPVSNAGFGNTTHGPEETAPGTYSLASVAANTELLVRPPTGAPLCRIVPREGEIHATVMPGRSLTLKFHDRRVSIDSVKIESEGGCPVSILLFLKTPLRMGPDTAEVEVLNAPPDESLVIHTRDAAYRTTVGTEGIVFIPAKQ